jgi:hypothetical protein
MLLRGTHQVPKPCYEFNLDWMGLPMLPDIEGFSLDTKKGIIRSFLTIHYSKTTGICCAKVKVPVPWSDIMKGQSRFIWPTCPLRRWPRVGAGQQAHGFGPHSTHQGLEHLHASPAPAVQNQAPRKTRAKRNASAMVPDQSPKKTKTTRSATRLLSDAPAKCTRSNVNNALGTRLWQKPKRYANYV